MLFYLQTLVLTLGIELVVVATLVRFLATGGASAALSTCVCVNLLTHPLAFLAHHWVGVPFLAVEVVVVVAECLAYGVIARVSWKGAIVLAGVSNLVSMTVGLIIF